MDVLPAIDLRSGQVVRLTRGDYDQQQVYSTDPVAVAQQFVAAGATWIHMVDLDAARSGTPTNTASVRAVVQGADARVEIGGGARNDATVDAYLELGVDRVVIGSAALKDWAWFERLIARPELAGKIALGLDAREGKLAIHGWTQQVQATAVELAGRVKGWPLAAIIYTDISRDGMLSGVNIDATARLIEATDVGVIASGGVRDIDDVRNCRKIGCAGVIIGKAYYEGQIDLAQACKEAAE